MLLHSDQGSTYRAYEYLKLFTVNNITQSMSRKGKCHDNAVAESFFATLKIELIKKQNYQTRQKAKNSIFKYIQMFYNPVRLHSSIGYQSPNDFEQAFYKTNPPT